MERKTCLETRGREVTRKRLLIQRLRMAVVTMHDYVRRDAVVLPGDKRWTPSSPEKNGKETYRWGVAEIQKMSPPTIVRCY